MHARLGEVLCMSAVSSAENNIIKTLSESIRRFCRSIELCDGYLRGYYGLRLVGSAISFGPLRILADVAMQASDRLLEVLPKAPKNSSTVMPVTDSAADLPTLSVPILQKLNEQATSKLAEIIRQANNGGYIPSEISAAKALLTKSTQSIKR